MRLTALAKQKRRNLKGRRFLKREAAMYGTGMCKKRPRNQYSCFRGRVHNKVGLYFWIVKNWTKIFEQHKQGPDECSCVMDNFMHRAGYENSLTPTSLRICKNTSEPATASVLEARMMQEYLQNVDDNDDGGEVVQKNFNSSTASPDTLKTGNELHVIDKNVNAVAHENFLKSVSNSEATETTNTSETEREGFQERRNYTRAVEERLFLNDLYNIRAEEGTSVESAHSLRHVLRQDVLTGEVHTGNSSSIFSLDNLDTTSQENVVSQDSAPLINLSTLEPVSDADVVSMAYLATLSVELRAFTDGTNADPEMGQNTTPDSDVLHVREGYILVYEQSDIVENTDISIRSYVAPFMAVDEASGTPSMFHIREEYILVQEESEEYTDESIR